jgi:hypothetical protein
VVELKPQEDAMLRSVSLLSGDDSHQIPTSLTAQIRLGCEHFLLLTSFGVLIALAPCASGQADNSSGSGQHKNSQPQICDGQKLSDTHPLSLALAKPRSTDEEMSGAEQQSVSQGSSESTSVDVSLPEVQRSSSAKQEQGLLCKKTKNASEPGRPDDQLPQSKQAADPEAVPQALTVSYADGELTINAQNVPLGNVIEAIRVRTGIAVELPSEAMDDRVFDHVGPAPLRDALTQLLYGSGSNYVIQTSSQNPQIVTKLVLSAQPRVASSRPPQHTNQPAANQADNEALSYGTGFNNEVPIQTVPTPIAQQGIPVGFNVQQAATASGKTPGQILDELQKRQLQVLDDQTPPQ